MMQGLERITGRIEADVQGELDALLAAAKAEAAEIEEDYRRRGEALRTELLAKAERDAAAREEQLLEEARAEGRRQLLSARWEMVERAYAMAGERLRGKVEGVETALRLEKSRSAAEVARRLFPEGWR